MNLNHVVISIYQKTLMQTKAVRSVLKGKLDVAGENVHSTFSSATNSVFMTEFDSLFFGFICYIGWIMAYSIQGILTH